MYSHVLKFGHIRLKFKFMNILSCICLCTETIPSINDLMGEASLLHVLSTSVKYTVLVDKKSVQKESCTLKNPEECMITGGVYNHESVLERVVMGPGSQGQCVDCTDVDLSLLQKVMVPLVFLKGFDVHK